MQQQQSIINISPSSSQAQSSQLSSEPPGHPGPRLHNLSGPDSEDVDEEGLDVVAAWRSKTEEGDGIAATRSGSSLTDSSGSAKGEDDALPRTDNAASFSSSTPPMSAVADWGGETPIGLGLSPRAAVVLK
jgi:hypothetical protein